MCRVCSNSVGGVGKEGCKVPVRGGKLVAEVLERRKEGRRRQGVGVYVMGDEVDEGWLLWGVVGCCTCCAEDSWWEGAHVTVVVRLSPSPGGGRGFDKQGAPSKVTGVGVFCSVSGRRQ